MIIQNNSITITFIFIIITLLILIIYYNIIAGIKYSKALIIDVNNIKQCKNEKNLPQITKDKTITIGDNKYLLGLNPIYYMTVCNRLCGGSTELNGSCTVKGYSQCIQDLKPCNKSSKALSTDGKNNYYAQSVKII